MLNRFLFPALAMVGILAFTLPSHAQAPPTLQDLKTSIDALKVSIDKANTPNTGTPAPTNSQILAAIYPCPTGYGYPHYLTCLAQGESIATYNLVVAALPAPTLVAMAQDAKPPAPPQLESYASTNLTAATNNGKFIDGLKKTQKLNVTYKIDQKSFMLYVTGSASDLAKINKALKAPPPPAKATLSVAGTNETEAKEMSKNLENLAKAFNVPITILTRGNVVYVLGPQTALTTIKGPFERIYNPQKLK